MKLDTVIKSALFGLVAGTNLLLSACSTLPKPKVECEFNNKGEWKCKIIVGMEKASGNYNNLAQIMNEDFALDFSHSPNTLLDDQLNIGSITLKSNGLPIATKISTYQKNGQIIVAANSNELVNWLASYNGQADEIVLTVSDLKFEANLGTNTVVMEVTQNGNVFAGASTSEYISPLSYTAQKIDSY